ncbi:hypothetical protein RYX36_032385 [Vicia faba]
MVDQGLDGRQPVDLQKHPSRIVPTLQNIVSTVNWDSFWKLVDFEIRGVLA